MGESVMEGTILQWLKQPGDRVAEDEPLLEVATDKVDTDIPSPMDGTLVEILAEAGTVVAVDVPIAIIETNAGEVKPAPKAETAAAAPIVTPAPKQAPATPTPQAKPAPAPVSAAKPKKENGGNRSGFFSPLVMTIARREGISLSELEDIEGSGKEGRVTKEDVLSYLKTRSEVRVDISDAHLEMRTDEEPTSRLSDVIERAAAQAEGLEPDEDAPAAKEINLQGYTGAYELVEMDRMRKIISERMLASKRISAHVSSFVEADVSAMVSWRGKYKQAFMDREGLTLTLTPLFVEAVIKAIKDFPMVNISVQDTTIIVKKQINVGLAVALPNGNLVVPVIKHADDLNIVGLTRQVNDLAKRARAGKLKPTDLEGGTYSISNIGSFGNVLGTPIINQPQCAILALGAVVKKPAVISTPQGDVIGIRHQMFLSHTYDHRVIDGALGGMFVRRVADYLEKFDSTRDPFH